ncbi:e3 ubiquitin-protein ligase RNF19A [Trichonephila inaurata madagascariensis]|uniref:RBR-type E3 ubiquitin transferase n=1 Tax=Trichonephila inaurata madagascariensis TaxID=2747483 RepID=A0A8X6XFF7_9ARAC|nr:e3 ubiquitin-protein ligase RNF19A [Trichonephila inaurata madagascariensis]
MQGCWLLKITGKTTTPITTLVLFCYWMTNMEATLLINYNSCNIHLTEMAGSSSGFSSSNTNKKHGLSRFSLARLFNLTGYAPRTTGQRCSSNFDNDRRSESNSIGFGAGAPVRTQQNKNDSSRFPLAGPSSSSSESSSFRNINAESKDASQEGLKKVKEFLECPLCLFELPRQSFPDIRSCTHRACFQCLQQYLKIEISESRVNITCPECTEPIHPSDICLILNDDSLLGKYESFMLRRVLITEPDARWCPAPDCGYAVIARGCAGCPKLKCERPGCNTFFCYHCKQEWHPNQTCDAARAQRAHQYANPRASSVSFSQDSIVQTGDDIKPCPCCKVLIIKMDDGSCNHMTCSVCGTEFCWLCMKEISDLHYLSPSGCTFWGKKPWSRKKKIMWQLGMLVGAPVGIALIAGIAVPAIIIGIPVWVGRKLHAKYTRPATSRHSRNLIVTAGVVGSVVVSPILAGIAVGIGVPILLAYVYGVVPVSLCRSGGCGVSTSASGVRIEFDEENEIGMGNNPSAGNYDGASVDTAASQRGVNPSIGEVSLGMSASLSLGSSSHLDRITMNQDREDDPESASNVALAGSIASASLMGAGKLEVQADVSSNKRFSLSSHSETASATVSANMSLADDASMKALAGSILGYRDSSAVTPVEVHVDAQNSDTLTETVSLGKSEASFNLHEYFQLAGASVDKIDCASLSQAPCADGTLYPALRLKLSKSSKKRHHSSTVPEVAEFDCQKNADSVSLQSENHFLPSHVQFNELKECCVSFIDESPSADNLTKPNECSSDSEESTLKYYDTNSAHVKINSMKQPTCKEITNLKKFHEANSVKRSISFCNSCTSTHHSCCPSAFQNGATPNKSAGNHFPTEISSESNALSNRAYKSPCSLQDISIEVIPVKDDLKCSPSSKTVPASVSSKPLLESIQGHKKHLQADKQECSIDIFHLSTTQPCTKHFKQGKDNRTYLYPESNTADSKIPHNFEML